jgi:hypothetical protein
MFRKPGICYADLVDMGVSAPVFLIEKCYLHVLEKMK